MAKVVTFGELMLRLSPPGFERLLQSPMLVATFGGGEANVAVSLAAFGLESVYITALAEEPHRRRGDSRAARRRRAHRPDRPQRQSRRHLLRRGRGQPARLRRHLRPRQFLDRRDEARRGRLGRDDEGRRLAARDRHHAGARRQRRGRDPPGLRGGARRRRAGQRRSQLPQEAVDRGAGAAGHGSLDARRRHRHRQRRGPAVGAGRARARHRCDQRSARRGGLPPGGRAGDPRFRPEDGGDHAARKPVRERQRLERGPLGCHDRDDAPQPALRRPAGRPHRRRRQLCGRADLRAGHRPQPRRRASLRRCGERAQADDSRRFQSRLGRRSRSARRGRRVGVRVRRARNGTCDVPSRTPTSQHVPAPAARSSSRLT